MSFPFFDLTKVSVSFPFFVSFPQQTELSKEVCRQWISDPAAVESTLRKPRAHPYAIKKIRSAEDVLSEPLTFVGPVLRRLFE